MKFLALLKDRLQEYCNNYFIKVDLFESKYAGYTWCKPDEQLPSPTRFSQIADFLADDIISEKYLENEMFSDPDYEFAYTYCQSKGLFHKIKLKTSRGGKVDAALITLMISFRVHFLFLWNDGVARENFSEKINAITAFKKEAF